MANFNVFVSTPSAWVPPRTLTLPATPETGSIELVVFTIAGPPSQIITLTGFGFSYDTGGSLLGGVITGLSLTQGPAGREVPMWSASGLLIEADAFLSAARVDLWPLLLDGDDELIGGTGSDRLAGGAGHDSLVGGNGNDRLEGGSGNDTLVGGDGNDALFGGAGNDVLDPGAGRDVIRAAAGDDLVRATQVETMAGFGETWDGGAGMDTLAIALPPGGLLDLGQATVTGFEVLRFETASRLAIGASALLPIERIELTYATRLPGGATNGPAELLLRGAGLFDLSGFAVEGLAERSLRIAIDDGNGAVVFGGEDTADLANDSILGGAGDSSIYGGGGNDSLQGGGGQDLLDGGADNDTLGGGDGNDTVQGGDGADLMDGGIGNDLMEGGAGNDTATGGAGADTMRGGAGTDSLMGGDNDDLLEGGTENDTLRGDAGADTLKGDAGLDRLYGGTGNDSLQGGDHNDQLWGDADDDILEGGNGADRLDGGTGSDLLLGGAANDTLTGGDGSDILDGGAGADVMNGGAGDDTYFWVFGDGDTITDSAGIDRVEVTGALFSLPTGIENAKLNNAGSLIGNTLDNVLTGTDFNDFLSGGGGHDRLVARTGSDTMTGGAGNDVFVIGYGNLGVSLPGGLGTPTEIFGPGAGTRITDFSRTAGNRDVIDVSGMFLHVAFVEPHVPGNTPGGTTITYETVGGDTLLRFHIGGEDYQIQVVGVTGVWTTADFLGY